MITGNDREKQQITVTFYHSFLIVMRNIHIDPKGEKKTSYKAVINMIARFGYCVSFRGI